MSCVCERKNAGRNTLDWKHVQPWAKSMFPHHKDSKGNLKYVHVKISKTKKYYSVQYYDKARSGKNKVIHVGAFENPHVAGLAYSLFCAFLLHRRKDHVMMMEKLLRWCTRPCVYMNGLTGEEAALKELNQMKKSMDEESQSKKRKMNDTRVDERECIISFPPSVTSFSPRL